MFQRDQPNKTTLNQPQAINDSKTPSPTQARASGEAREVQDMDLLIEPAPNSEEIKDRPVRKDHTGGGKTKPPKAKKTKKP